MNPQEEKKKKKKEQKEKLKKNNNNNKKQRGTEGLKVQQPQQLIPLLVIFIFFFFFIRPFLSLSLFHSRSLSLSLSLPMTAKVQKLLPPFNNFIKEIIKLANNIVSTRSQHPKTPSQVVHSFSNPNLTFPLHHSSL